MVRHTRMPAPTRVKNLTNAELKRELKARNIRWDKRSKKPELLKLLQNGGGLRDQTPKTPITGDDTLSGFSAGSDNPPGQNTVVPAEGRYDTGVYIRGTSHRAAANIAPSQNYGITQPGISHPTLTGLDDPDPHTTDAPDCRIDQPGIPEFTTANDTGGPGQELAPRQQSPLSPHLPWSPNQHLAADQPQLPATHNLELVRSLETALAHLRSMDPALAARPVPATVATATAPGYTLHTALGQPETGFYSTPVPIWNAAQTIKPIQQAMGAMSHQSGNDIIPVPHTIPTNYQQAQATHLPVGHIGTGVASDSLPHIDIVSPQIRRDIISGKDINLAALLIPGYKGELENNRHLVQGDQVIALRPLSDSRLQKSLTLPEFIMAFAVFKNVMTEAYPIRRPELDAYERDIIEMAQRYSGLAFYEYHRAFSARAAALLLNFNQKINWAIRDTKLYASIFSGMKGNVCAICTSMMHSTEFCPQVNTTKSKQYNPILEGSRSNNYANKGFQSRDTTQIRPKVFLAGKEICNNYNSTRGCYRMERDCPYIHACLNCKTGGHAVGTCVKSQRSNVNERQTSRLGKNK